MKSVMDGPEKVKAKVVARTIGKDGEVKVFFRFLQLTKRNLNDRICMAVVKSGSFLYANAWRLIAGDMIWVTPGKHRNANILEGCF